MSYRLAITDRTECPGAAGDWPARFLVTKTVPGQPPERQQLAALPPDLATLIEGTPTKTFLQGQIKLWIFPNLEENTT